jgi:hypothetical protein
MLRVWSGGDAPRRRCPCRCRPDLGGARSWSRSRSQPLVLGTANPSSPRSRAAAACRHRRPCRRRPDCHRALGLSLDRGHGPWSLVPPISPPRAHVLPLLVHECPPSGIRHLCGVPRPLRLRGNQGQVEVPPVPLPLPVEEGPPCGIGHSLGHRVHCRVSVLAAVVDHARSPLLLDAKEIPLGISDHRHRRRHQQRWQRR